MTLTQQKVLGLTGAAFFLATPGCPKEEPPAIGSVESVLLRPCTLEEVIRFVESSVVRRQVLEVYAPELPGALREPKKEQRAYDLNKDGSADCEITVGIGLQSESEIVEEGRTWGSQHSWWELYPTPDGINVDRVTWSVWEMDGLLLEVEGEIDEGSDGTKDGDFLYRGRELVYRSRVIPSEDGH